MRIPTLVSLALAFLSTQATAQVQPGWGVYSKLNSPGQTNVAGLTIFAPLNGISPCKYNTPFVSVTNLPSALISNGALGGTDSVLVRDSDGTVVAGEVGVAKTIGIYHLTLNGAAVKSFVFHSLGNASGLAEIHQMAWYTNSKIVFTHTGVPGPTGTALPSQGIATLDLTSGAVTSVPVTFPTGIGSINALALDRSGKTAYMGFYSPHEVYSVPFPTGGTATKVGSTLPDGPYQLDVDHLGTVHVGTFNKGLFILRTGAWTNLDTTPQLNAMTIDRVSGDVLFAAVPVSTASILYRWSASGGRKTLPGMAAKDAATGMAIRSSMIPYGSQSGGAVSYTWQIAPNPGGLPMVGNNGFSLSVATTANPSASLIGFAAQLASSPIPLCQATLLLDAPVGIRPLTQNTLALPVPPYSGLCGLTVYAQTLHEDSTGLVSTPALRITVQ